MRSVGRLTREPTRTVRSDHEHARSLSKSESSLPAHKRFLPASNSTSFRVKRQRRQKQTSHRNMTSTTIYRIDCGCWPARTRTGPTNGTTTSTLSRVIRPCSPTDGASEQSRPESPALVDSSVSAPRYTIFVRRKWPATTRTVTALSADKSDGPTATSRERCRRRDGCREGRPAGRDTCPPRRRPARRRCRGSRPGAGNRPTR